MLNGGDSSSGTLTSGGTESILLAVKAHRLVWPIAAAAAVAVVVVVFLVVFHLFLPLVLLF